MDLVYRMRTSGNGVSAFAASRRPFKLHYGPPPPSRQHVRAYALAIVAFRVLTGYGCKLSSFPVTRGRKTSRR